MGLKHSHDHHHHEPIPVPTASASEIAKKRYREVVKVTLIGSVFDFLLGVGKIAGGLVGNSAALVADGVHSLSDLFTDFIVLYATKHAHQEADEEHPYGHGRIETLATVGLGLALLLVAIGISWDAALRLFNPETLLQPGLLALALASVSIVVKEALYHYSMHIARKYRSNLLKANAWHSRTDAISSFIVVLGVAGSMAGLNYLDAVAAVGVAFMIAKISWDLIWHSLRELIDTGLEPDRVEAIRNSILNVDGVETLHVLRTRRMGGTALVDVHIQVAPTISVSEGHHVSESVRARVVDEIDEVADVMVHIDPEDDEAAAPSEHLPMRKTVLASLHRAWDKLEHAGRIADDDITLHYLDGKIDVELLLPLDCFEDKPQAQQIARQFRETAREAQFIDDVKVLFH